MDTETVLCTISLCISVPTIVANGFLIRHFLRIRTGK